MRGFFISYFLSDPHIEDQPGGRKMYTKTRLEEVMNVTRSTDRSRELNLDPIFDEMENQVLLHFGGPDCVKNFRVTYVPEVLVYSIYFTHFRTNESEPRNLGIMVLSSSSIETEAKRIKDTLYGNLEKN